MKDKLTTNHFIKLDFISKWDIKRFMERKQHEQRKCAQFDGFERTKVTKATAGKEKTEWQRRETKVCF